MTTSTKPNMFGISNAYLLKALKGQTAYVTPLADDTPVIVLAKTPYMILRTVVTDDLIAKYPVTTDQGFIGTTRRGWQFFEDKAAIARLHVTSALLEDQGGNLVRKLTSQDGEVVYVAKRLLDMYGLEASSLSEFIFESVEYGSAPVSKCPIRISKGIGATVGYVMPMQNIQELTF